MSRHVKLLGVLALALAVALAACSASDDDTADHAADEAAGEQDTSAVSGGEEAAWEGDDAGGRATDADSAASEGEEPAALPAQARDVDGQHVIRQGRFTVIYESSFDAAFGDVSSIAEGLGGGVTSVTSETLEDGAAAGEVTVKVPVDAYDRLLVEVAGLGEVVDRHVTEEDVSGEVVDLRSRLRHLERQEAFYLDLFDDAEDVSDAITIQGHLESVQQRKEEVQGRLDHLDQRTSTSTLRVRLVPEGHEREGLDPRTAGFAGYWSDAVDAFVTVSGTLVVVAVGGAPLLLVGALVLAAAVVLLRAWRRDGGAQPSAGSATMTGE